MGVVVCLFVVFGFVSPCVSFGGCWVWGWVGFCTCWGLNVLVLFGVQCSVGWMDARWLVCVIMALIFVRFVLFY